jgi:predicted dinucleotide-binding enzyme
MQIKQGDILLLAYPYQALQQLLEFVKANF